MADEIDVKTNQPIDPEKGGLVRTKDLPVIKAHAEDGTPENVSDTDAKRPPLKELTSLLYVGTSDSVSISKDDFKNGVGIDAPEDLVFDFTNKFSVPISSVNAAVVDHLIEDPNFQVV